MKRLILMRHAKSDWSAGARTDFERPLNKRGRAAAPAMAGWLERESFLPDLALVSASARTEETWARMGLAAPKISDRRLYHASAEAILTAAQNADEAAACVLILGHQPGMQDAANRLLASERVDRFPTAKAAVIDFDTPSWFEIGWGEGSLVAEMAPKELPA